MSQRKEQVASVLHRAIQPVLSDGLADPRLSGVIPTITKVTVSGDLRSATINVSIMPEEKQELAMHALRAAARHIRRQVSDAVSVHRMPLLDFKLDTSLKREARILAALSEIRAEDSQTNTQSSSQDEEPRQ